MTLSENMFSTCRFSSQKIKPHLFLKISNSISTDTFRTCIWYFTWYLLVNIQRNVHCLWRHKICSHPYLPETMGTHEMFQWISVREKPSRLTRRPHLFLPEKPPRHTRWSHQDTWDHFLETHEMSSPVSARETTKTHEMISPRYEIISRRPEMMSQRHTKCSQISAIEKPSRQTRCSHRFVPERNHQDTWDDLSETHYIFSPISARVTPKTHKMFSPRHKRWSQRDTQDVLIKTQEIFSPISAREPSSSRIW